MSGQIILSGIIVGFIAFATVLWWADRTTSRRP
jgi:hypothetical protein